MTIDECKANLITISILFDDIEQSEVIALTCKNAYDWLEELKELKQEEYDNTQFQLMSYADGYNKAIDDVFKGLLENTKPTEKYIDSAIIVRVLKQLKGENI